MSTDAVPQHDVEHAFGDKPTVTLQRDRLLGLLAASSGAKQLLLAHTVSRARSLMPLVRGDQGPPPFEDDIIDTDLSPTLSPLLVLGVLAMLVGLFFAVVQAS